MPNDIDTSLYGAGLLGDAQSPKRQGNLAERFIIPPFSVLSARDGWWANRKRNWIALGIKSELGRGGESAVSTAAANPGGSLMPAMDYRNRERDNSTGKAVTGTAAQTATAAAQAPVTAVAARVVPPATKAPAAAAQAPVAARPQQAPVSIVMRPRGYGLPAAPAAVAAAASATGRIPYEDPFLAAYADVLAAAAGAPIEFDAWADDSPRSAIGADVECYVNFFVVCLRRFSDGKRLAFERSRRRDFDPDALRRVLADNVIVSFNGAAYDLPMIYLALAGKDTVALKAASDRVIFGKDVKPWTVEKELGIRVPKLNHIDLIEASPAVRQSLKIIAGRLHARWVVDLPYPPEAMLTNEQMNVVTLYCMESDLAATELLYRSLREPLELRAALGRQHGVDLRSKSDSQIGEVLVKRQVEKALGRRVERPPAMDGTFGYTPPDFVRFDDPALVKVLDDLRAARFYVNGAGKIVPPAFLESLKVKLGDATYSVGIGGLHSNESHRTLKSDGECFLVDTDVASQYPNIIMKLGLYPPAMGETFLDVYGKLIDERLDAKRRQQAIEREITDLEYQLKEIEGA